MCDITIIIPAFHESGLVNRCIKRLLRQRSITENEIILVDGDRNGSSCQAVSDDFREKVKFLYSEQGRAMQMNTGARKAKGSILLFLHADTVLPKNGLIRIMDLMRDESITGGAFNLGIDTRNWLLKLIAFNSSLRSRITHIPYGDQAIFIRKSVFEALGGYGDIRLFEDIDLMKRLKKGNYTIRILDDHVLASARRWEQEGILRCTLRNWILTLLYKAGVSPNVLAKWYPSKQV